LNPLELANLNPHLALAVLHMLREVIVEQVPELRPDFPSFGACLFSIGVHDDVCIATFQFRDSGVPAGGTMELSEFERLRDAVGSARRFADVKRLAPLSEHFAWNRLLIVADVSAGELMWDPISHDLVEWLNEFPLPRAVNINEKRVRTALPTPPQYSLSALQDTLWILECDEACVQGTAFDLQGYHTVTNEHVVEGTMNLRAFRAHDVARSYPVRCLQKNPALDLAVIEIVGAPPTTSLEAAKGIVLERMQHIAVCGFPNYRRGDSGILTPGIVTGTRMKSGVRRLLTNAGIVRGMSGGPALGANNQVVGICVTGADFIQEGRETEDQSIIPVDALDLLN
jgi:hypothetical protein